MSVRTRLIATLSINLCVLCALLAYHVRTTRRAVGIGEELTEIASRIHDASVTQARRVAQFDETAAKYEVTRDARYLSRFRELIAAFDADVNRLHETALSAAERVAVDSLATTWSRVSPVMERLASLLTAGRRSARDSLAAMYASFPSLAARIQVLIDASQREMVAKLERNALNARQAERVSWVAGGAALLLGVLVSVLLVRSISHGIARLHEGAGQIARGQFGYRVPDVRQDEFGSLGRAFNAMARRLGELEEMKRGFVSKVSHDLKTPLVSMRETVHAMLDEVPGPLTNAQRRLLELNHASAERLAQMLSKLLDISKLDAAMAPVRALTDPVAVVRRGVERQSYADARGRIELYVDADGAQLECDEAQIAQAIDNLLENALKFSPPDTPVHVVVRSLAARPANIPALRWAPVTRRARGAPVLHVVVSDSGPGIAVAERERIFERFYQGEAGRTVARSGVGLGLSIARDAVVRHGGVLWVEDNPNVVRGSVFNILLPGLIPSVRNASDRSMEPLTLRSEGA